MGRLPKFVDIVSIIVSIDNALIATDEIASIEDNINLIKVYDDTSPEVLDLKEQIDKLSSDERKLIYARYFEELTQSETSNILGMSQVQVSRNETKILKKLRNSL